MSTSQGCGAAARIRECLTRPIRNPDAVTTFTEAFFPP